MLWTPFDVLVLTKLAPPRGRQGTIPRTRLSALLNRALERRATLVQAPAGFGKTTALAEWATRRAEHIAWVSLDAGERRADTYLAYLLTAIQQVHNDLGMHARRELFEHGEHGVDTAVKLLLNELAHFPEPIIIILDDYHAAASEAVNAVTAHLCDHLPSQVHLIIATRTDPGFPLSRLQVHGDLAVLTADDLMLDPFEAQAFVEQHFPQPLDLDARSALVESAGGWVAGLQMAALAFAGAPSERFVSVLAHGHSDGSLVEDFLVEEVLSVQDPETVDFLLRVSVAAQLHPELATVLTGSDDAPQRLENVVRAQLFIARLAGTETWYRFHDLFHDVLRKRALARLGQQRVRALHALAADWYLARDDQSSAVSHALAAEDWPRASALIKPAMDELLRRERPWELLNWTQHLPRSLIEQDVEIAICLAWAQNRLGHYDTIGDTLSLIDRQLAERPSLALQARTEMIRAGVARGRARAQELLTHATLARDLMLRAMRDAEREQHHDAEQPYLGRSEVWMPLLRTARLQIASGLLRAGQPIEAEREHRALWDEFRALPRIPLLSPAAEGAWACMLQGRLRTAESLLREALEVAADRRDDMIDHRQVLIVLGDLLREWNRLGEAESMLLDAERLSKRGHFRTFMPELYMTLARVRSARGDVEQAELDFQHAAAAAGELGSARLAATARAHHVRHLARNGELRLASEWGLERRLTADSEITVESVVELFTFARVLIAEEEAEDAVRLLERLADEAELAGRGHEIIESLVLRAIAYQDLLELDRAASVLDQALQLSTAEGYTRLYLDEDRAMIRLFRSASHRDVDTREMRRLMAAAGVNVSRAPMRHPDLTEPLTPREAEVLKLIAVGLTNREISEEMFISIATVKRHITNIYGKLGCSSRTLVIERGKDLGLI